MKGNDFAMSGFKVLGYKFGTALTQFPKWDPIFASHNLRLPPRSVLFFVLFCFLKPRCLFPCPSTTACMRHNNTTHIDRTPRPRQVEFSASGPYSFVCLTSPPSLPLRLYVWHCVSAQPNSFRSDAPSARCDLFVSLLYLMYRLCSMCRASCGRRARFLCLRCSSGGWHDFIWPVQQEFIPSVVGKQSCHQA